MSDLQWNAERHSLKQMAAARDGRILVAIGVSSGAEARQLHHTISQLHEQKAAADGLPDLGYILRAEIVRQTDIIEQATWMASLDTGTPAWPIGVDIDTGYGNEPSSVILTCHQVGKQGAQYVQIEDQYAINKSCGHMAGSTVEGKRTVSADEMIDLRLKPAVQYARAQEDMMVMARTDAVATVGIEEAVRRAQLYAETGAEMIFIEAPEDERQLTRSADAFKNMAVLSVANMIEASPKTPYKSAQELQALGFSVALYCIGPLLAGRAAQQRYFSIVSRGHSVMAGADLRPERWFDGFNEVIGRHQTEAWNAFFHQSESGQ